MKKIFIPEFNVFGYSVDINMDIENPQEFLQICSDEQLNALLKSHTEREIYETCALIQKEIERRRNLIDTKKETQL